VAAELDDRYTTAPSRKPGYRPVWDVIRQELASAGFTQAEGAERLLAWRFA